VRPLRPRRKSSAPPVDALTAARCSSSCLASLSGFVSRDHPGLREARDLIDLVLLCRAEINGLVKILVDAKLIDEKVAERVFADEYEWFAREKAKFLNGGLSDEGIVIHGAGRN